MKYRKPSPQDCVRELAKEWSEYAETTPCRESAITARDRLFALQLFVIRCGWKKLDQELDTLYDQTLKKRVWK